MCCVSILKTRLEELHRLWDLLMKRLAERGKRLQLALDLLQYLREAEELLYWISDKRNFVERQDLGRDLEHLEQIQVIVKKFEEFLQVRRCAHSVLWAQAALLFSALFTCAAAPPRAPRSYRTDWRRAIKLINRFSSSAFARHLALVTLALLR